MYKELMTVLVSIAAALVTFWKFRHELNEKPAESALTDARIQIDGRYITVSGLTVPELSALAKALTSQPRQDQPAKTRV